jgi:DNA/RNA endonuclease YhcR with UshA esterase domain
MLLAINYIQARPIRDIRMNDASGVPLLNDSVVTFSGIVSVANQFGYSGPAFVFDNTGGVAVYDANVSQLVIGDSVTITGTVTLYSGLTEISSITLTRHSSGHIVNPQAMVIPDIARVDTAAGYVENEGTLIALNQVIIPGASGNFAGQTNYTIQDSLGNSSQIRIDGDVSSIVGVPIPAGFFNMTGVISQYVYSAPYFNGYQVMPRYIADLGIVPPPPTETTIPIDSAICDPDSNGIPNLRGAEVTITGIVTAPTGIYSHTQTDIYVQDNTAGVNVFSFTWQPVELGDSVIVHGNVYFYRGKTEINNAVITIVANDRPLPEPYQITCAAMNREPHEGEFVKLTGVFTSAFLLAGDQNYLLVDSTGTCTMRIDLDSRVPGLVMVQDTFTVIGIKSQYTSDTFPPVNTGYQFMPRYPTDFSRTLNNALPLLTINEVQRPGLDGSSSYYEGQYVKVRGRITGPANIFTSGSSYSLYIQDATNGVNIYAPQVDASYADLLDVSGTEWECIGRVTEYSGLTEVANGVMWLIDSIPQEITTQLLPFNTAVTEGMESKLIQVTGQVIVEPASVGGAMNFTIKNGTPGIAVRVVDAAGIPLTWVKKNRRVRVVGIVGQYDTDYPYNTGYQVLVRFPSDLVDMTDSVPQATAMRIDTVYPNPFSPTDPDPVRQTALIKINSPTDYKVYLEVFDMEGRLVKRLLTNNPGGYNELYWDGTDDNQEPCPIGIYILNLKGITPDGKDAFVRKPIVIATKL